MGDARIALPGTSGNYLSTADVNLLDADTAHRQQGVGIWTSIFRFSSSGLVASNETEFGGFVSRYVRTATSTAYIGTANQVYPVTGSTAYVFSTRVYIEDGASAIFSLQYNQWDSGSGDLGFANAATVHTLVDGWNTLVFTFTTHVDAATIRLRLYEFNGAVNDVIDVDWMCFRTGSDGTFVPSLRIVGDLDLRAKVAAVSWATASGQSFIGNRTATTGYELGITAAGAIFAYHNDGSSRVETSTAYTLVDGEATEIRFTVDVSTQACVWYQDGAQVDTDVLADTDPGSPSGLGMQVGQSTNSASVVFAGDIYHVEVRDGIDGPVVAHYDAETMANRVSMQPSASDTWTGDDTRTWTLNGADSVMEWPNLLQAGSDAVMSHLHNLDDPPESLGIVGALTEITGLSGDTEYRYALLNYLNIDT